MQVGYCSHLPAVTGCGRLRSKEAEDGEGSGRGAESGHRICQEKVANMPENVVNEDMNNEGGEWLSASERSFSERAVNDLGELGAARRRSGTRKTPQVVHSRTIPSCKGFSSE